MTAAYDMLCRTLDAARAKDTLAVSDFRKRLEHYVRSEIHRFPELRDEVYQEIRCWGERTSQHQQVLSQGIPVSALSESLPTCSEACRCGDPGDEEVIRRILRLES